MAKKLYDWEPIQKNSKREFGVMELPTNQMIRKFSKKKEALATVERLSKGFGFHGWTPTFFLVDNL